MGDYMDFKKKNRKESLTRTIRLSGEVYDKICEIAEVNEISFNSVVNQILENFLEDNSRE